MSENYTFEATFANECSDTKDFEYELDPNDPNRIEGLLACWRKAMESYCANDPKAKARFNQFTQKNFWNFHDLHDLNIEYKDETGKSNKLHCVSTNYALLGLDAE